MVGSMGFRSSLAPVSPCNEQRDKNPFARVRDAAEPRLTVVFEHTQMYRDVSSNFATVMKQVSKRNPSRLHLILIYFFAFLQVRALVASGPHRTPNRAPAFEAAAPWDAALRTPTAGTSDPYNSTPFLLSTDPHRASTSHDPSPYPSHAPTSPYTASQGYAASQGYGAHTQQGGTSTQQGAAYTRAQGAGQPVRRLTGMRTTPHAFAAARAPLGSVPQQQLGAGLPSHSTSHAAASSAIPSSSAAASLSLQNAGNAGFAGNAGNAGNAGIVGTAGRGGAAMRGAASSSAIPAPPAQQQQQHWIPMRASLLTQRPAGGLAINVAASASVGVKRRRADDNAGRDVASEPSDSDGGGIAGVGRRRAAPRRRIEAAGPSGALAGCVFVFPFWLRFVNVRGFFWVCSVRSIQGPNTHAALRFSSAISPACGQANTRSLMV